MTPVQPKRTSLLWLVVFLPLTVFVAFTFLHLLSWYRSLSHPMNSAFLISAVAVAGTTTAYGIVEIILCLSRRQTFLRPAFAIIALIVGAIAAGALNAQSKQFVDTTIFPELRVSPTPTP